MRVTEICLTVLAVATALVYAAPADVKDCCGSGGFNIGLGGRLDIGASAGSDPLAVPVPLAVPAPAPAAPAPPAEPVPVNRNDREGDQVNVIVNANHN